MNNEVAQRQEKAKTLMNDNGFGALMYSNTFSTGALVMMFFVIFAIPFTSFGRFA